MHTFRSQRYLRNTAVALLLFLLTAHVGSLVGEQRLWAQQDDAPAAGDDQQAPAGEGQEGQAENEQGAATATADQPKTAEPPPSYLEWALGALGWGYSLIFLFLSLTLVALIVMNLLAARRDVLCPLELVEAFEANLNEQKFQDAYELAKNDESFLGMVLAAGMAKLSAGYEKGIAAMQEVGEEENMKLEHRLSYMALIGTISPMIGLFGTVHGMISSFQVIASNATTPKPSELAQGISTALFTTLIGLFIAIPAIAAYNLLRNRVARLVLEVGILSENLMSRFQEPAAKQ